MAFVPNDMIEDLAIEILHLYQNVEVQILASIADRLSKGMDSSQWDTIKLQQVRIQQQEIKSIIDELDKVKPDQINKAAKIAYARGIEAADNELSIKGALAQIDTAKVKALAQATIFKLDGMVTPILRSADDIYRRVITQSTQLMATGYKTRLQATQIALERFSDSGVSAFIDKSGRRWTMPSYAEMATRTGFVQANLQGTTDRMNELDQDLCYVTEHPKECEKCRPWEGKILSMSGNNPNYPSLAEARDAGLFHPRCGHSMAIYIKGITELPEKTSSPQLYEDGQKEKYLQRGVRQWEKRQAVAIDPDYKKAAEAKVKEWKQRLKEHKKATK